MIEDVDRNVFLDCNAGIAVVAAGHCHPKVVEAIREQAGKLIHMSGTDFYYENMVELAEKLAALAPGDSAKRGLFWQFRYGGGGSRAQDGSLPHWTWPIYRVLRRIFTAGRWARWH